MFLYNSSYDGRDENGNPLPEEQAKAEFSASLQYVYVPTIDTSIPNKFNSNTKSNPNPIKLVNNKNKIEAFHNEILQFSGRMISKGIDTFDNTGFGTLTIYSASLDYGTEGASAENFEVLVYGLHLPGHYTIKEQNGNVVITLLDNYIDYDSVTINDIYVIGKFK